MILDDDVKIALLSLQWGTSPMGTARSKGHSEIVNILLQKM